jgi:hypothetical protein
MAPKKKTHPKSGPLDKQLEEEFEKAKESEYKIFVLGRYATIIVEAFKKGMNSDEEHNICVTLTRFYRNSPPEVQRACLRVLGMMKAEGSSESIMGLELFGMEYAKDESVEQHVLFNVLVAPRYPLSES